MAVAVIADIVGSRRLPDRAGAQRLLDDTIRRVDQDIPLATRRLQPTVGDEQQAMYPTLPAALTSLLLLQLALPDEVQCRFGVGIGHTADVDAAAGAIPEGPAWWAARHAIEHVHSAQQRAVPSARTWVVAAEEEDEGVHSAVRMANAYLLARDRLVGAMTERERRLTYGRCRGITQRELAGAEGITQPAVSQALAAAGSAVIVEGLRTLQGEVRG